MPARRALLLALFLLLFLLPLTLVISRRPTQTTSRGATEPPKPNSQKTGEPLYAKNQIIVKFREAQPILEADEIQTFSQMEKDNLPTAIVKLNQLQPIQSMEKIFKKIALPSGLDQKVPPTELINPEANKVFLLTFANEIEPAIVIRELRKNPEVEYAEPNYIYRATFTPNDPYFLDSYPNNVGNRDPNWNPPYDYQWNLKKIELDKAWDSYSPKEQTAIAIIDTGLDYTHPEFGSCTLEQVKSNHCQKITPGWNFINDTPDPKDDAFHSTHVGGIVTATTDNNLGIASFDKGGFLRLIPLKALDSQGSGFLSDLLAAIDYAIEVKASVVNMSWGGGGKSRALEEAIKRGLSQKIVFVASAGNDQTDVENFNPANIEGVIAVSATDETDELAKYSNFGSLISVAAPGGSKEYNVLSLLQDPQTNPDPFLKKYIVGEKYLRLSGTSMAAPHVSGLAGLIKTQDPSLDHQKIRNIIENSADDLGAAGFDTKYGFGRINAAKALTQMNSQLPPQALITSPPEDLLIGSTLIIKGYADGESFKSYQLAYNFAPDCDPQTAGYSESGVVIEHPQNPIPRREVLGKINFPNTVPNGRFCLKLTVKAGGREAFFLRHLNLDKSIAAGWPIATGVEYAMQHVVVGDINSNGKKEVILVDPKEAKLYAITPNGENSPGFPVPSQHNPEIVPYTAALNQEKIFLPVNLTYLAGQILAWDGRNGQILEPWSPPHWTEHTYLGQPPGTTVIADLNRDGQKEIILAETITWNLPAKRPAKVSVFDQERKYLPGWEGGRAYPDPETLPNEGLVVGMPTDPLVGNVSGTADSPLEIVAAVSDYDGVSFYWPRKIVVFGADGQIVNKFLTSRAKEVITEMALGDIDHDGLEEIIIASKILRDWGRITVFKADGQIVWRYTFSAAGADILSDYPVSLALADFNSDNYPEVFTSSARGQGIILGKDGQPMLLAPSDTFFKEFAEYPTISKLENGHFLIVQSVTGLEGSRVTAVEYNPQENKFSAPPNFPKIISSDFSAVGYPVSADLDADGFLELVVPTMISLDDYYLYAFQTAIKLAEDGVQWSQYHNDEGHTGAYRAAQAPPQKCRTCEKFTGCLVGKTCMQICQAHPDQCESKPCEAGAACTCRAGAPEEYRCEK